MGQQQKKLYLRAAEASDMMLLYRWANDPVVRRNAFHSKAISLGEHKVWFHKILQNPEAQIFILMDGEEAVGQIRLNIENGEQVIDYSVDVAKRGRGYGMELLSLVEKKCFSFFPLLGKVKYGNVASCRLFEQLGYVCESKNGYNAYRKNVSINNGYKSGGGGQNPPC